MKRSKYKVRAQAGFTLVELGVVVVVLSAVISLVLGGRSLIGWFNGKGEGDLIVNAISCTRTSWLGLTFNGITLATVVNSGCFPEQNIANRGTAAATANNRFGSPYVVAAATVRSANDGFSITSNNVPSGSCSAVLNVLSSVASVLTVNGVQVKAAGAAINDATAATACSANTLATIVASATKSGE